MKKALLLALGLSAIHAFATTPDETSARLLMLTGGPQVLISFVSGGLFLLVGLIPAYIAFGIGLMRLSKKLAPGIHPALSWIPILQIIPFVAVSGNSLWWIGAIIISCIPRFFFPDNFLFNLLGGLFLFAIIVYLYYCLAKRLKRGIGTTVLLTFFSIIMIPYLGCIAQKKRTNIAFALGIPATVLIVFGASLIGYSVFSAINGLNSFQNQLGSNAFDTPTGEQNISLPDVTLPPNTTNDQDVELPDVPLQTNDTTDVTTN